MLLSRVSSNTTATSTAAIRNVRFTSTPVGRCAQNSGHPPTGSVVKILPCAQSQPLSSLSLYKAGI
jgi:hypothetical protein